MNDYEYVMGFITLGELPHEDFIGEEKWLMVKHSIRGWELPGGKVKSGESNEEAIIREVCEEARVNSFVRQEPKKYEKGLVYWLGVSGEVKPSELKRLDPIIDDVEWFSSPPTNLAWGIEELKKIIKLFKH